MVIHTFICDSCGHSINDHTTKEIHRCPLCGTDMRWDLGGVGIPDGDPKGFWSLEMGALGEQQAEIKKEHPTARFNQLGARWVESPKALKKVLKERGMVELTEDRKYREKTNDALEKAREGARNRR